MRKAFAPLLVLALFVGVPAGAETEETIVDDGTYFYDVDGDCVGDTDDHTQGEALRHWHVGVPFAGPDAEPAGGFGCLGGPTSYDVTVPDGGATLTGSVRYTWDQNVPGGGFNDLHIHIEDAEGNRVYSTFEADGPRPVNPLAPEILKHTVEVDLEAGEYTIVEDVFFGEHSAWLTQLELVP